MTPSVFACVAAMLGPAPFVACILLTVVGAFLAGMVVDPEWERQQMRRYRRWRNRQARAHKRNDPP